jgi:hypothetical protein
MRRTSSSIFYRQPHQTPRHEKWWRASPTASNYNKAVECLKVHFGREDLLVEFYVRELLKLTMAMNSKEDKVMLSFLYDRIETQLRALGTLGMATKKYAATLFSLVESCLCEEVLRA